jgi:hypothetical protein
VIAAVIDSQRPAIPRRVRSVIDAARADAHIVKMAAAGVAQVMIEIGRGTEMLARPPASGVVGRAFILGLPCDNVIGRAKQLTLFLLLRSLIIRLLEETLLP